MDEKRNEARHFTYSIYKNSKRISPNGKTAQNVSTSFSEDMGQK